MKVEWNKKYTTISVYAFLVVCCSIIFYLISSDLDIFTSKISNVIAILQPIIIGCVLAYLFNFILTFYEEKLFRGEFFKKISHKQKRGLGLLLTYATVFLTLYLFIQFVLPQVVDSISGLANDIPAYVNNATVFLDDLMNKLKVDDQYMALAIDKWNEFVNYVIKIATDLLPILGSTVKVVASSVWNIVIGLIVSIYLLIDKENFHALGKKITRATLPEAIADKVLELTYRSNDTFGKFIVGKIIDSLIIGVLTFFVLTIFKMPYVLLISVIIGITNIIPFFGPFFGAIPSVIIILFVSPMQALWFLVIILVIQQIDGNIIGPKILGDSIGISAFWILFSLLVAGKFFGLIGMIVGVPVFAIIYSIIKEIVENKLRKKGLPIETDDYK
ncbi:AI-2E family transporter [Romboutsia weinsteinii]|uniref:AI-2E family transporter n=1 Tax=Romboutsia weinsteinii TaxID=2020949 RepID=A0A371J2E7_9FIRM|nr:AI-2E family transporter [Romboutsia weinsteinii]RDY26982.1 AI-2E family transporter [Romboutsia weinsteinii]